MTAEEFEALKRGDVVEWVDGTLGLVRAVSNGIVRVRWELGGLSMFTVADLDSFRGVRHTMVCR